MARDFTKVGVVGLGTIGAGIAEVFARNGLQVVGVEMDAQALEKGKARIEQSLQRAVDRGKMAADEQASVLKNISFSTDIGDFADRELVIEAVPEKIELKKQLFAELDKIVPEDAVLATNTSSLSVTDMAAATSHPKRVIGMHFFNPAPVQKLVEVIDNVITDHEVEEDVTALATRSGGIAIEGTFSTILRSAMMGAEYSFSHSGGMPTKSCSAASRDLLQIGVLIAPG
mgnify:CR=1 FL=1